MATNEQIKAFITHLGALAVAETNRRIAEGKGFVLPSVCIAQSAHETGWGTAGIMVKANAYFGIKAGGSWKGKVYRADTWEVDSGGAYNTTANFRAYDTLEDSVADYYNLITNNSRYSNGISYGTDSKAWLTPKATITAIWNGGYATDTIYVEKIMNIINGRELAYYDTLIDGSAINHTYNKSNLVNGAYVLTDSGRSIGNDSSITNAVALSWNNAITIEKTVNAFFTYDDSAYIVNSATLIGDTPTIPDTTIPLGIASGTRVEYTAGTKVGFTIRKKDNSALTVDDLPNDFTISFGTYSSGGGAPSHNETVINGIAKFVKVE